MIYRNEKTRPGGQPGICLKQQTLYLQAFLAADVERTRVYLRERTSNMRQLCHVFGTALFAFRSPSQGGAK